MPKFLDYNPEQVYLLPPSVRDVLGENHVCFFLHQAVEALELSAFEQGYADDGRPAYHPALMLKVWLYAYAERNRRGFRPTRPARSAAADRLAQGCSPEISASRLLKAQYRRCVKSSFHTDSSAVPLCAALLRG